MPLELISLFRSMGTAAAATASTASAAAAGAAPFHQVAKCSANRRGD